MLDSYFAHNNVSEVGIPRHIILLSEKRFQEIVQESFAQQQHNNYFEKRVQEPELVSKVFFYTLSVNRF